MTIGQVAKAAGLSTSAIRYYESVGVIPGPARKNGVRQYDPTAVDELKALRFYRAAGIPIRGLASLTKHMRGSKHRRDVWEDLMRACITDLDAHIREAKHKRRMLADAVNCHCDGKREDCFVLQAADAALPEDKL